MSAGIDSRGNAIASLDAAVAAGRAALDEPAAKRVLAAGAIDLVLFCAGHYKAMRANAMDVP